MVAARAPAEQAVPTPDPVGAIPRQYNFTFDLFSDRDLAWSQKTAFIDANNVPASAYEFAMLYGIQRTLQQRLLAARRPLRVLIAYGEYWFAWYMRRLAERPANVWFVVKNLLR